MQSVQRALVRGGVASLVMVSLWGAGLAQAQAVDRAAAEKQPKSKATLAIEQVAAMKAAGVPPGRGIDQFSLGDLDRDQVFTAVAPCRIVDTRNAGGPIAAGTTRSFDVDGPSFTAQGGVNAACGIPSGVASAVVMTITVTQTQGSNGFITGFRLGSPQPNASLLNWNAPNQNIANTTVVPVFPGAGNDFNIFAGNGGTQVVVDVVGYFSAPTVTLPDTTLVQQTTDILAPGARASVVLTCPPGYAATGGNIASTAAGLVDPVATNTLFRNGTQMELYVKNTNNAPNSFFVQLQCLRIPGR